MTQWEYMHVGCYNLAATEEDQINKLGQNGWELVAAKPNATVQAYWDLIFKRPTQAVECIYCNYKAVEGSCYCEIHKAYVEATK